MEHQIRYRLCQRFYIYQKMAEYEKQTNAWHLKKQTESMKREIIYYFHLMFIFKKRVLFFSKYKKLMFSNFRATSNVFVTTKIFFPRICFDARYLVMNLFFILILGQGFQLRLFVLAFIFGARVLITNLCVLLIYYIIFSSLIYYSYSKFWRNKIRYGKMEWNL